jgi:hypothetical protein
MNASNIILTRFLYIKDEVEIALLMCILQKKKESLFWAYELYYSGFENDVFELIWTIYYDFFATLNPLFEIFIKEKEEEWSCKKSDVIIGQIIETLLIRPFTCDVYILHHLYKQKYTPIENTNTNSIIEWITSNNYKKISECIFSQNTEENLTKIFKLFISAIKQIDVTKKIKKINKSKRSIVLLKKQMVSRILGVFSKKTKAKQFYMIFTEDKVEPFKNELVYSMKPYRILLNACIFGVNDHEYLSLFTLRRYQLPNLLDSYNNEWLFYASFSPIWLKRIKECNGIIDYEKKQIVFKTEDDEELFYDRFNYEPDEQSLELKKRTVPDISTEPNKTWITFQENYNMNGLVSLVEDM